MQKTVQAAPLHGYATRRPAPAHPAVVSIRATLPPAEALTGAPEAVAEAISHWHDLGARMHDHELKALAADQAATAATASYRQRVKEAIAAGDDPARLRDETGKHEAIARAHRDFARTARGQLERHGYVLGGLLAEHAETIAGNVDPQLDAAADEVRDAIALLQAKASNWASLLGVRTWLSQIALGVESVPSFHADGRRGTKAVTEALAGVSDLLHESSKLRSDEATVRDWRAQQASIQAANEKQFGSNR
jgi:hypothetical protein